jgi:hypothetical protein
MWMWDWIVQNKQWVFSGGGIAAFGVLWWIINKFWPKHEAAAPVTTISPVIAQAPSIAPSIVMNPTINIDSRPPEPKVAASPAPLATTVPKPQPNLRVEPIKRGKIYLVGETWSFRPTSTSEAFRGVLADISNAPIDEAYTAKAAIRALINIEIGGRLHTYSPLPWLDDFTNLVYLETGARKTVVLAVGKIAPMGVWTFVLNHRRDYATGTPMDWTNQCPILSDLPFELVMIDMNSGAILAKFKYLWTFDVELNWPDLKPVD